MEGRAALTGAGNLPCRGLIHAVGPLWRGGKNREEDLLYDCVYMSLTIATKENFKSIAFPAISSGVFGCPLHISTRLVVEAVKDFIDHNNHTSLTEIHLIDNNKDGAQSFLAAVQKKFTLQAITSTSAPLSSMGKLLA